MTIVISGKGSACYWCGKEFKWSSSGFCSGKCKRDFDTCTKELYEMTNNKEEWLRRRIEQSEYNRRQWERIEKRGGGFLGRLLVALEDLAIGVVYVLLFSAVLLFFLISVLEIAAFYHGIEKSIWKPQ